VQYTVKNTVYGPIINDIEEIRGKNNLALRWTSLEGNDTTYGDSRFFLIIVSMLCSIWRMLEIFPSLEKRCVCMLRLRRILYMRIRMDI
jgi:hypothetical protein